MSHLFTRQFSCVRFWPVLKSKKHANLLKSLCRHRYYIGAVCLFCFFWFFWTQTRKTDGILIKKKRIPCVFSNISIVGISVSLPVAVNNLVPASQVRFQQFRVTERFCVEGSNKRSDGGLSKAAKRSDGGQQWERGAHKWISLGPRIS